MAYKVLIVEDDPMVADINRHYVETNKNFMVAEICRNGEEALEYLEKNSVDLVVLDVFMPVMDGVEVLNQIRARNISAEVIMVTAANDTQTIERTMKDGVLDYLIKPFFMERFQVSLKKFEAKVKTLKQNSVLDQNSIDSLISNSVKTKSEELPKGIQKKTLEVVLKYFEENSSWQTADMIAEKCGISIVTIRHYMNYLVEIKIIEESINYETGGRPSILYRAV